MYSKYTYSTCKVGAEAIGNALAKLVGYTGEGPAFGGEFGIGLREIGSDTIIPTHWLFYTITKDTNVALVDVFNSAGPFDELLALGATETQINIGKANMHVSIVDIPSNPVAFAHQFITQLGLEVIPLS